MPDSAGPGPLPRIPRMPSPPPVDQAAEAAHDALLRRLGPALKHDLVVHLQSLTMMSEVLAARLERQADLPAQGADLLLPQVTRLHRLARDAVDSCLRIAHWLTPPDDDAIELATCVAQTLDLLRHPLGVRGYALRGQVQGPALLVARTRLQTVLAATLLHLSDHPPPARALEVQARGGHDQAQVTVRLVDPLPVAPAATPADEAAPAGAGHASWLAGHGGRRLQASDLSFLAAAAGVALTRQDDTVSLQVPRWVAAPLGVAPR